MHSETIILDIAGSELSFEVLFNFTPGEPEVIRGLWENSSPGTPDEYEILSMHFGELDVSWLLEEIDEDQIIEQLEDLLENKED